MHMNNHIAKSTRCCLMERLLNDYADDDDGEFPERCLHAQGAFDSSIKRQKSEETKQQLTYFNGLH